MSTAQYRGRRVALLTQHGKERLLGPVLETALGCRVERVTGFDTDQLGTFTRETPRAGTQIEAARRKARIGMRLVGANIGLASEGAFGADPHTGLLPWDVEILVFIDAEGGLEVVAAADGPACRRHERVMTWDALARLASEAGFPDHHLVLRPQDQDDQRMIKGIGDWATLERAFRQSAAESDNGAVFAESDLRAHCNPTRQAIIRRAGEDLAARLASACPACASPGFWITTHLPGLACRWCGTPTRAPRAEHWACPRCSHGEERAMNATAADPAHCLQCNP